MSSKPNSKKPSNDNGLNLGLNKDIIKQSQSKPNKTSNLFNPFINTNAIQNNNFNLYNPFINNTNLNQNKNEQEKTKMELDSIQMINQKELLEFKYINLI